MNTTTESTGTPARARRTVRCIVLGHRWHRQRRSDRTVLLTCVRCGHVDVVEKDLDLGPLLGMSGPIGPFGG